MLKYKKLPLIYQYQRKFFYSRGRKSGGQLGAAEDLFADLDHLAAQVVIAFDHVGHFVAGVHDGGVVAPTQGFANLRQGDVGFFAHQVHGDLAGQGHFARAVAAKQRLGGDTEGAGHNVHDLARFIALRRGSRSARAELTSWW